MDIGSLTGQVAIEDQVTDKLTEMSSRVKEFAEGFEGALGAVGIGVLAASAAIGGMITSIVALGDHGSDVNDIASTLDRFAGSAENAEKILEEMRQGTLHTVDNLDLMRSSSKLLAAGLNLTADNFKTLSSAAFVLQNQGLGPTKDMLDLVSTAMLTGHTRSLEMKLGKMDLSHAEENFARTLGVSVGHLNAAGKIEAKRIGLLEALEQKVKAAGKQERDFGEQLEFANATIANWVEELERAVAASPDVLKAMSTIGDALGRAFGAGQKTLLDGIVASIDWFSRGVTATVPYIESFFGAIGKTWEVVKFFAPLIETVGAGVLGYGIALGIAEIATISFTAYTKLLTIAMALESGEMVVATTTLSSFGLAIGTFMAAYALGTWLEKNTKFVRRLSDGFEYASLRLQGFSGAEADAIIASEHAREAEDKRTKSMTDQQRAMERVGSVEGGLVDLTEKHSTVLDKNRFANSKLTAEEEKAKEQKKKLEGEVRKLESTLLTIPPALQHIGRSFDESKLATIVDEVGKIEQNAHIASFGFKGMTDSLKNVGIEVVKTENELHDFAAYDFTGPILKKNAKLVDGLHDLAGSFAQLAQIAGDAFGGIVKDIATVVAAMDVGTKAGEQMQTAWDTIGTNGQRDWGSMAAGAIQAVAAMDAATKSTSRWKATLGGAMTGASIASKFDIPGAGTVGFVAGALVGLIRSAGAAERAINPIREQFVQLHGGLDALNRKAHDAGVSLTAMLNAKNAEQYNQAISAITDALAFQDHSVQVLDDTIQKYGFSIEELGPKWTAQKLNEQAGSLLQDYDVLTAAGVDHLAIISKMGPTLQTYVSQAEKTGTAIPENLRPVLQSMIDLGTLTDASGDKMTDLAGLTFTESLDKKFTTLLDTINRLVEAISRGLGTAIKNIPAPDPLHVPVYLDYQPGQERAYAGGGVVYAAMGALLPFTPRGTDTVPAMLTPGEGVVTTAGMARLGASGLNALNSGDGQSNKDVVAAVDRLRSELRSDLNEKLPRAVARSVGHELVRFRAS